MSGFSQPVEMLEVGLDRHWQQDLKRLIRAHLTELGKNLVAIKHDLNEELQVALGLSQFVRLSL